MTEASRTLLGRHAGASKSAAPRRHRARVVQLSHTGKLPSIAHPLAGWFADDPLAVTAIRGGGDCPHVFGILNAAVPFLLDLFRHSADTFNSSRDRSSK
jgi:hypothetical protein